VIPRRPLPLFIALASLATAACAPDVSTVRMGPVAPSRPLDCGLQLIDATPAQGVPPGLELLGYVRVIHEEGRSPNDPDVLKLVKPEACKLGGEEVSVGSSMNFTNGFRSGSSLLYAVWRHKVAAGKPIKF
jgi:hypothetical protein